MHRYPHILPNPTPATTRGGSHPGWVSTAFVTGGTDRTYA